MKKENEAKILLLNNQKFVSLSIKNRKTSPEILIKLMEEMGEVAEAYLQLTKADGSGYKGNISKEALAEEIIDAQMIVQSLVVRFLDNESNEDELIYKMLETGVSLANSEKEKPIQDLLSYMMSHHKEIKKTEKSYTSEELLLKLSEKNGEVTREILGFKEQKYTNTTTRLTVLFSLVEMSNLLLKLYNIMINDNHLYNDLVEKKVEKWHRVTSNN